MKKITLLLITFFLTIYNINSQTTNIPDSNFEQELINLGYDDVINGIVLTSNISGITNLNITNKNISNLSGIEDFQSLTHLFCGTNNLSSLDVSQNINLNVLNCSINNLSSLIVTTNTLLTGLYCDANNLTTLDISQNLLLTDLSCRVNQISSLNITQNTNLISINCGQNLLTSLNTSQNINLENLFCQTNQIDLLILDQNINIEGLSCSDNLLTTLNLNMLSNLKTFWCSGNQLTSLDLSNNNVLRNLDCHNNQLETLDIRNGNNQNINQFNTLGNINLNCIYVDDINFSTSNWTDIETNTNFVLSETECNLLKIEEQTANKTTVYPNPSENIISISIIDNCNFQIFNIQGKLIKKGKLSSEDNKIDIASFEKGLYLLKIKNSGFSILKKIMKK